MIQRQITYTEPTIGRDKTIVATLSMMEVEVGGVQRPCITASVPGKSMVAVDVVDAVESALYGRSAGIFGDLEGTLLSTVEAAGQTSLSVLSHSEFSSGDPVAIFNSEGDTPEFHLVTAPPAAYTIVIDRGLAATMYKGAYVVNLSQRHFASGRGFNYQQGVRAQLQAPSPVEIDVADSTGNTIDVTVTSVLSQDKATHYDVYVRNAAFTRIEPNWQPDLADQTSIASALHVSTYCGGANCVPDGAGASLSSILPVWVAVVAKTGAGQMDVDESVVSNIVSFTLD